MNRTAQRKNRSLIETLRPDSNDLSWSELFGTAGDKSFYLPAVSYDDRPAVLVAKPAVYSTQATALACTQHTESDVAPAIAPGATENIQLDHEPVVPQGDAGSNAKDAAPIIAPIMTCGTPTIPKPVFEPTQPQNSQSSSGRTVVTEHSTSTDRTTITEQGPTSSVESSQSPQGGGGAKRPVHGTPDPVNPIDEIWKEYRDHRATLKYPWELFHDTKLKELHKAAIRAEIRHRNSLAHFLTNISSEKKNEGAAKASGGSVD
ncbi:hypothetical protein F5Y16DRAFT_245449 [Xylariaceae sp. FL0255]|nr:hypothetical protein F5Y16DRAFT_245449 [Xylariaceae sp. FL0255]